MWQKMHGKEKKHYWGNILYIYIYIFFSSNVEIFFDGTKLTNELMKYIYRN